MKRLERHVALYEYAYKSSTATVLVYMDRMALLDLLDTYARVQERDLLRSKLDNGCAEFCSER